VRITATAVAAVANEPTLGFGATCHVCLRRVVRSGETTLASCGLAASWDVVLGAQPWRLFLATRPQ
jgi:hypothetical protein